MPTTYSIDIQSIKKHLPFFIAFCMPLLFVAFSYVDTRNSHSNYWIHAFGWPFVAVVSVENTAIPNATPNERCYGFPEIVADFSSCVILACIAYYSVAIVIVPTFPRFTLFNSMAMVAAVFAGVAFAVNDLGIFQCTIPIESFEYGTLEFKRPYSHTLLATIYVVLTIFGIIAYFRQTLERTNPP